MDRPWLKFFARDWLDDIELRKCSAVAARALIDLMCIAHEGVPYGYLSARSGPLSDKILASRCVLTLAKFRASITELEHHGRLHRSEAGALYIKRMVRDEEIRSARAAGGKQGGNPQLKKVNLDFQMTSRGRAGADRLPSDSDSEFSERVSPPESEALDQIRRWLFEFMGKGWPEPDLALCQQVYGAMNGAKLEELGLFLRRLHAQGKRPHKSWAWFVGLVGDQFGRKPHGHASAV